MLAQERIEYCKANAIKWQRHAERNARDAAEAYVVGLYMMAIRQQDAAREAHYISTYYTNSLALWREAAKG